MTFGPTKGHERREVPLPRFLVDELAVHVAGRSPDELLFTGERGAVMRSQTFQRAALTEAAEAIGEPGFHPHELRHTAASLAIAVRRRRQGRSADARPQERDHDARPVRAPLRRPARRCG